MQPVVIQPRATPTTIYATAAPATVLLNRRGAVAINPTVNPVVITATVEVLT